MSEKLANHGGPKAVTVETRELWKRPVEEEKEAVCELIDRGFLSGSGTGLPKEFEEEFRQYIGCKYCISLDHGSSALAAAFYAVGVGPGDEFITPSAGYLGTYCGALHMGARPVFCEIDPKSLLMDPADVEKRITPRTKAIVPIHLNGRICDLDGLMHISQKYGIPIIEDACHVHGAEWDGKKIGNVGHITCFSLQGVLPGGKPVCGGEGGIFCTNNREYYERQLIYCHLHRVGVLDELTNPEYKRLDSELLGWKWRAHPLALAIARVALKSLDYRNQKRREHRKKLFDGISPLAGVEPTYDYPKATPAGFYGGIKLIYNPEELDGLPIEKFLQALKAEGVPVGSRGFGHLEHLRSIYTRGFDLWGNNRGPLGADFKRYKRGDFPISERMHERVFTLPAYIEPPDGLIDQIIAAFEKVTKNYKALL